MKINFDGASKGNPGIDGCGIIIRDENGICKGVEAIPIGIHTNHVAEASVALHGFMLAKNKNYRKVWLEGDSLNIIRCLNNDTNPSWTIFNIIHKEKF